LYHKKTKNDPSTGNIADKEQKNKAAAKNIHYRSLE